MKLKETTRQDYQNRLNIVLDYIRENPDNPGTLDELAAKACFSPWHFHRIFSGMTGESLKSYLRRIRLERAAQRLRKTSQPVIHIALDAGFESHAAFTRAFGKAFGVSPNEYRNNSDIAEVVSVKYISTIWERNIPSMKIDIVKFEPTKVLFVRNVGSYDTCGIAWEKLCGFCGPRGLILPNCKFIGRSYDDPEVTPSDKIRYDACLTVPDDCPESGNGIELGEIEGGTYAMTTHFGPFELLSETYSKLCGQLIPQMGYEVANGPSLEIYQNDPDNTKPEDLITDIYVPLIEG